MAVDMLPSDLELRTHKPGLATHRHSVERGDTVTFVYEGEKRTVLVLENEDGQHLKGIAKERQGEFRNYLWHKISGLAYAKPFVKAVPVTVVHFEMLPEQLPTVSSSVDANLRFTRKNGDVLVVAIYRDGYANYYMNNGTYHPVATRSTEPLRMLQTISEFMAG